MRSPSDVSGDPLADWPVRTPLYDDEGRVLLVFSLAESTRSGRPWADGVWRPPTVSLEECLEAALDAFAGYAVSTSDKALAEALLSRGSERIRHAHAMSHSLVVLPDQALNPQVAVHRLPAQELLGRVDRLGSLNFAAYPPGHPDHEHADIAAAVREIRGIGLGEILGPYLEVSQVALVDDAIVGACLVVDRDGMPPEGGPWIVDVFRDPTAAVGGIGRALVIHALRASQQAGLAGVSLAVSHENANAVALYTALGFVDVSQSWTVALPGPRVSS
jgi:ribosomal protein S18 acetylase RimI-like enzyme